MAWGRGTTATPMVLSAPPSHANKCWYELHENEDILARLALFQEKLPNVPCHWHHLAPGLWDATIAAISLAFSLAPQRQPLLLCSPCSCSIGCASQWCFLPISSDSIELSTPLFLWLLSQEHFCAPSLTRCPGPDMGLSSSSVPGARMGRRCNCWNISLPSKFMSWNPNPQCLRM